MTTSVSQPSRLLGPDFARGSALLGIALANALVVWCILAETPDGMVQTKAGVIADGSLWDKLTVFISALFVHVRGLPMFATLLGYGIGMIYLRQERKGVALGQNKRVLLRRYGFLALFGLVHTVFLFFGDIMLTYGLLALLVISLAGLSDKTIATIAGVLFGAGLVMAFCVIYFFPALARGFTGGTGSYVKDQLIMGGFVVLALPIQLLASTLVIPLIMVGFIAGRREVFRNSQQYAKQMRIAVGISAVIILCVGIPFGLSAIGVIGNPQLFYAINISVGMATGPGLVVVMFWAASGLEKRGLDKTLPVQMITALGRMSMTGYVLQSVLFGIIVASYGFGFGSGAGAMTVSLIAFGVWLVTLLFAYLWSRSYKSGPLEMMHRSLAYKKAPADQTPALVASEERAS